MGGEKEGGAGGQDGSVPISNDWVHSECSFELLTVDYEVGNSFLRCSGFAKDAKDNDVVGSYQKRILERQCQINACTGAIAVLERWVSFPRLVDKWKSTILTKRERMTKEMELFDADTHEYLTRKAEVWKLHYLQECMEKLMQIEEKRPFVVEDIIEYRQMLDRNIGRFRKNIRHLVVSKDVAVKGAGESGDELLVFARIVGVSRKTGVLNLNQKKMMKVPPSLYQLSNLQVLNLEYNSIGWIDPEIAQLQSLSKLYLANNDLYELPISMAKLRKTLCVLSLHGNPLREDFWEKYKEGVQALLAYLDYLKEKGLTEEEQISHYLQKGRRTNTLSASVQGRASTARAGPRGGRASVLASTSPHPATAPAAVGESKARPSPPAIPHLDTKKVAAAAAAASHDTLVKGLLGRSPDIRKRMALKEDKGKGKIVAGVPPTADQLHSDRAALQMGFSSMRASSVSPIMAKTMPSLARSALSSTTARGRMQQSDGRVSADMKSVRFFNSTAPLQASAAAPHPPSSAGGGGGGSSPGRTLDAVQSGTLSEEEARPATSRPAIGKTFEPFGSSYVGLPQPRISARTAALTVKWAVSFGEKMVEKVDPFGGTHVPASPVVKKALTSGGLVLARPHHLEGDHLRAFSHWRASRIRDYCSFVPGEKKKKVEEEVEEHPSEEDVLKALLEDSSLVLSDDNNANGLLPTKKASTAVTPRAKFFRL
mmetsp:Transcript_5093/g.11125  ORF Transcript_5093/g.11125 Transcript_5093/m.11125 type:complete len:711 (-) Transcript_5093:1063-3195(-)